MVLIALYIGPGRWPNALIRRWQRSPYSHCEVITSVVADQYECWSASAQDGGVRRKVMTLNPAHWELYLMRRADPDKVRAWFFDHEGDGYDLLGLLGFAWRPWRGERSKWWCSEAAAAAMGFREPFRFDVATFAEVVRRYGYRQPIA